MPAFKVRFAASCLLGVAAPLAAETSPTLEELVITAQRLSENVQAVPISASVASSSWIDELGAKTPTDLIPYIPGFTGDTVGSGNPLWAIRGISTTA